MSIDSQATEDENKSGKGSGEENPPPPLPPNLGDIVPPDNVNESGKGSGEKDPPLSQIHLENDDNSYDSQYLTTLYDQIKSHEAIAARDPLQHEIEMKKLKSKYDNALKAKKEYDKKKKIGKKIHPIHSVADHHEDKPKPYYFGRR